VKNISRVTILAMEKKPKDEVRIREEQKATLSLNHLLVNRYSNTTHKKADRAQGMRKDHSWIPNILYETTTAQ